MRGFLNNEARWIKVAIDEPSRRQKVSRLIDQLSRAIKNVKKQFFKGEKNTDMNAIKHAT